MKEGIPAKTSTHQHLKHLKQQFLAIKTLYEFFKTKCML